MQSLKHRAVLLQTTPEKQKIQNWHLVLLMHVKGSVSMTQVDFIYIQILKSRNLGDLAPPYKLSGFKRWKERKEGIKNQGSVNLHYFFIDIY